jgi:hypothetical protein
MEKYLLILGLLSIFSTLVIVGCTEPAVTCNYPYIKVGTSCCLDSNSNNICDNDEPAKEEKVEYTNPVRSSSEAIDKIEYNQNAKNGWQMSARQTNCGASYLDPSRATIFVAKISFSDNLISCDSYGYWDIKNAAISSGFNDYPENFFEYMDSCDNRLIDIFKKAVRGFDSEYRHVIAPLEDSCSNCDEGYAVVLGCISADNNENYMMGFGFVDSKTGEVYW